MDVVTAKKLIKLYGVVRKDLFRVRRQLEIMEYIKVVRKGSQTYWLLKPLPTTLAEIDQAYIAYANTSQVNVIFPQLIERLLTVSSELGRWLSYLSSRHSLYIASIEQEVIRLDYVVHILSTMDLSKCNCQVVWEPAVDELIPPKVGKQARIQNVGRILQSIYNVLDTNYFLDTNYQDREAIAWAVRELGKVNLPNKLQP